ncbi:EamA-like transporter family protein [compost metagenome]
MIILVILILVLVNSIAQVLLKLGSTKTGNTAISLINIYILLGYALFFVSTILSVYLLKLMELKNFTLIISLNYVGTLILSRFFLKERFTVKKITATALIVLGVVYFNL